MRPRYYAEFQQLRAFPINELGALLHITEIRSRSAGETNGLGARQQKGLDTRAGSL